MEKGCILPHNLLQQIQKEGNVVLMSLAHFCNCTEAEILNVLTKRNKEQLTKSDMLTNRYLDKETRYGYTNYIQQNGKKKREISIPCAPLKKIQEVIKQRLSYVPISFAATAGKPGDSAEKNAEMHRYNRYLITMDIKNAYPSIDTSRVYKNLLGSLYKPLDTRCPFLETKENKELFVRAITHLCVNNNTLPQGASTSSQIQNIVMRSVDIQIQKKLPELTCSHMIYSRYADDITISFPHFSTKEILQEKMTGYQTRIEQSKKTDMTDKRYIDDIIASFAQDTFILTDDFDLKYLQNQIEQVKNKINQHPKLPKDKKYDYIGTVNQYKQQIKYSGWRINQVVDDLLEILGKKGRNINFKKLHTWTPQTMGQREINGMTFDDDGSRGITKKKQSQFVRLLDDMLDLPLEEIRYHRHYKGKFGVKNKNTDEELIATIQHTLQGVRNYLAQIYNEKGKKEQKIPADIQSRFQKLQEKRTNYPQWYEQWKKQEQEKNHRAIQKKSEKTDEKQTIRQNTQNDDLPF